MMKTVFALLAVVASFRPNGALAGPCKPLLSSSDAVKSSSTTNALTIESSVTGLSGTTDLFSTSITESAVSVVLTSTDTISILIVTTTDSLSSPTTGSLTTTTIWGETTITTATTDSSFTSTTESLITTASVAEDSTTTATTSAETTTSAAPDLPYLRNTGFDDYNDRWDPWTLVNAQNSGLSLSLTSSTLSSPNALELTNNGGGCITISQPLETSKLVAGTEYLATAWVAAKPLDGYGPPNCINGMFIFFSSGTMSYPKIILGPVLRQWQQLKTRVTFTDAEIASGQKIRMAGSCSNGVYKFDDVTFAPYEGN